MEETIAVGSWVERMAQVWMGAMLGTMTELVMATMVAMARLKAEVTATLRAEATAMLRAEAMATPRWPLSRAVGLKQVALALAARTLRVMARLWLSPLL